jgi:hypothetical protein
VPQSRAFAIFCVALTLFALVIAASITVIYGRVRPELALNAIPPAAPSPW